MMKTYAYTTLAIVFVLCLWRMSPPADFASDSLVTIGEGKSLYEIANDLEEDNAIRSSLWFRGFAKLFGGERSMKAGEYYMDRPQSVYLVAWRVLHGKYAVETVKLTIPEGFTAEKIAGLFDERFLAFERDEFIREAPEGYLFPDTYFAPTSATASSTIKTMNDNFKRKIKPLLGDIDESEHTLEEIVTMASLLEAEVKTREEREIVAGILWKRLSIGMALQVDSDLWTYEFSGLPDEPINNPGLDSIEAAVYPKASPYLYFLTGDDGMTHYSKNFDEHVEKKRQYINR